MNTAEKFRVIQALDNNAGIKITDDWAGDKWFVSTHIGTVDGCILSSCGGFALSVDQAIDNCFNEITKAKLVKINNKYYRWKGFMWQETQKNTVFPE